MEKRYERYCLADRLFYDSPTLIKGGGESDGRSDVTEYAPARAPVPEGYRRHRRDDWLVYEPKGVRPPPQGWKIHASATLNCAPEILEAVWAYCIPRRIPFKFIASPKLLFLRNSKYADRSSSGKFVTIYPADEAQFEAVLDELGAIVDGLAGPYILSDLRWGSGPLHVRYGSFAERWCIGRNGSRTRAIEDANGRLVPDKRGPTFQVPPWVTLPACLRPHLEARNATTLDGLPYRIDRPLHFSNGGGLYAAVDVRSGDRVVLKEARPHAALTRDHADAVTRLRHEYDMLVRLAGLDVVPGVRDYLTVGEHEFLVEELIDGETLRSVMLRRWPLFAREIDTAATARYGHWVLDVCARVERAADAVHDRSVVIGDLHANNVMVRPDGRVAIIDLESAAPAGEQRRPTLAAAAFMPPRDRTGVEADRYALACLRLYLFLPLTTLLLLDRGKAQRIAGAIAELFPVPREFLAEAVRVITGDSRATSARPRSATGRGAALEPDADGWRRARDSMTRAILASATPERDDRLYPGDVKQFDTGALNLAHGAAGVLYALDAVGAGRCPDHEAWLVQHAINAGPGTRVGFYDGLHGVAYALERLGRRSDALAVLDICMRRLRGKWDRLGLDLEGGLAGVGLNLAHFGEATADRSLWDAAWRVADVVAERLGDAESVPEVSGNGHPYAGLLRGSSGPALMFLRLYEHSGDRALLDLAAVALRQDLRRCIRTDHGTLDVNEGWRTMPYLADGTVGIGCVLDDYLAFRQDEEFAEASARIRPAAKGRFYTQTGLFHGRAGMILYLSRRHRPGTAGRDPVVAAHVRRLSWHALRYAGHLAFPGDQLLRLSMDLATGTAGVLLALGAALHEAAVQLPFLDVRGSARPATEDDLDPLFSQVEGGEINALP